MGQIHAVHLLYTYGNSPCIQQWEGLKTSLYTEVYKIIPALTVIKFAVQLEVI